MKKIKELFKTKQNFQTIVIIGILVLLLVVSAIIYKLTTPKVEDHPDTLVVKTLKEAEEKLGTKIPVLGENTNKYKYELYGYKWPWHAYVTYSKKEALEIAKDPNNLVLLDDYTDKSTREKKEINGIVVEFISENEDNNVRKAYWNYDRLFYVLEISVDSELNIEECVESFIDQLKAAYDAGELQ